MVFDSVFLSRVVDYCGNHPLATCLVALPALLAGSYYASRPRNLPPGPWGIPWVGSPHLLSDQAHHDFNNISKKYGELFTVMMGMRPMIVLNSNRLIKECFVKRGKEFGSRPAMYDLDYMNLFDELFNIPYSDKWRGRKQLMVRILRGVGFGSLLMEDTFLNHLDTMLAHIAKDKPVCTQEPIEKVLAMTIGDIVYSAHYSYDDPELLKLVGMATDWMKSLYKEGMAMGFWTDNVHHSLTRIMYPKMMENMRTANETMQKFLTEKIHEHRKTFVKGQVRDVIDGYLSERGDDPELTDLAFSSTILMLFPDAVDTTGSLLRFILSYLAYHPAWQRKVQAQIDAVCGTRRPSLKDRANLPLVEATIYEVGRVASVVCLSIAHCPMEATTLKGYNIPKDCYIMANIWAANNEKALFPQGETFAPETLINSDGNFVKNSNILWFSAGRRMCIGEAMAKNQAFLFVASVLQRYFLAFPRGAPLPCLTETRGGLIRTPPEQDICFTPRSETH